MANILVVWCPVRATYQCPISVVWCPVIMSPMSYISVVLIHLRPMSYSRHLYMPHLFSPYHKKVTRKFVRQSISSSHVCQNRVCAKHNKHVPLASHFTADPDATSTPQTQASQAGLIGWSRSVILVSILLISIGQRYINNRKIGITYSRKRWSFYHTEKWAGHINVSSISSMPAFLI